MSRFNPYLAGLGNMDVPSLVAIVYHAPRGAAETTELEWKTTWDLRPRFRRADLSRHVIGFANRDPDHAARVFGGHAFVLIGVAPGELGLPPELDPADITQMLTPYVGTQLSWHPVYVPFRGTRVLVLVVDPPRWGDPVWRLQRGSEDQDSGRVLKANTVFVRRPGTTVPADDEDLRRLDVRAGTARPELKVALDWNLGRRGNYIGVVVRNGIRAQPALLRQVGFTLSGTCELTDTDPTGSAVKIKAFAEFPIADNPGEISPGQELAFRLGLDKRIPVFWDEDTDLAPYVYFDDGHWLTAAPQKLIRLLQFHGWSNDPEADHMLTSMVLHCIDPPQFAGQVIRSDLTHAICHG